MENNSLFIFQVSDQQQMNFVDKIKNATAQTDDITYQTRLFLCKTCPELNKINQCKQCGCMAATKARFTNEKCPIGKWN